MLIFNVAFLLCVAYYSPASLTRAVAQTSDAKHHHAHLGESMLADVSPDVSIAEMSPGAGWKRENVAESQNRSYTAFTVCQPLDPQDASSGCQEHLYFEEKGTGKVYEVRGIPLPHRPFSDLTWADNHTLLFDRWSQPHYGFHYAVDVEQKKLVAAQNIVDES
jgi:hypothetical protein